MIRYEATIYCEGPKCEAYVTGLPEVLPEAAVHSATAKAKGWGRLNQRWFCSDCIDKGNIRPALNQQGL